MSRAQHLYVARYGDKVKVGITWFPASRMGQHQSNARRDGVQFEQLLLLPSHKEAEANERAVLAMFGTRGSSSEYMDADADEVIAFVRTLPCTPGEYIERSAGSVTSERWLRKREAAELLEVGTQTLDRYVKLGRLQAYETGLPRRPVYRIEDVLPLLQIVSNPPVMSGAAR